MTFSFLKRIFSRGDKPLEKVESIIQYTFQNKELLRESLSHRSSNENGFSNERLEYLGDAILGLIVSEFLYKKFPGLHEGDLTKLKSSLVNEVVLAKISTKSGLCEYIMLSAEEEKAGGRAKLSITSDALEALFGSVYLDGGLKSAQNVIRNLILENYEEHVNDKSLHNYKGELLEHVQKNGTSTPRYEVIDEIGPDHEKIFIVNVLIDKKEMGTGEGSTKKEAEQNAARTALEKIKPGANGNSIID